MSKLEIAQVCSRAHKI